MSVKKIKTTFLPFFLFVLFFGMNKSYAAPGDTTLVTVFENLDINHYGNFDTIIAMPTDKSYQKIRLLYTLGKRSCPGEQYCADWDYTTSVYAKQAGSTDDSLQLMRVITPYAGSWSTTTTFTYVEEVTDFASILRNQVAFNYFYEGYSWGFTLTLKVELIEGEAPRKVVDLYPIYDGHFQYGNATNSIENYLTAKTIPYATNAASGRIRNIITGHGMDNTQGCSEFCSKWYRMNVNSQNAGQVQLWKDDCGLNNLYPQQGTWLFERANWCPGEKVRSLYHSVGDFAMAGNDINIDMDMQPYTAGGGDVPPSYFISSQFFAYAAPTYQLDAAITDIIAPSDNENYFRFNPICSSPVIKVRNEGANPLTSLKIAYTVDGGSPEFYNWTGNLGFMEEEEIRLGNVYILPSSTGNHSFKVELVKINNEEQDETAWNNVYRSTFKNVPTYPQSFRVYMKTNKATMGGVSETSWKILDRNGNVVASREDAEPNVTYDDTVSLGVGCYTFVMDDANCDGFSWWYYPNYSTNPGNGQLRFIKTTSNSTLKSFNGDFGCQLVERFIVDGTYLDVSETGLNEGNVLLYPNPTNDKITVGFPSNVKNITYQVFDANGRLIQENKEQFIENGKIQFSTSRFDNGMYYLKCYDNDHTDNIVTKKFFVIK